MEEEFIKKNLESKIEKIIDYIKLNPSLYQDSQKTKENYNSKSKIVMDYVEGKTKILKNYLIIYKSKGGN
ncbi:hypothetical protein H8D83_01775 [Candidatus Woesearchaeota archaeon]|nr:hypothetical protein [Candidatus Woesearchaeota archaeon]MBL7051001.1 hypothetical protein [Candidatus Woesearchaeota archaeon]